MRLGDIFWWSIKLILVGLLILISTASISADKIILDMARADLEPVLRVNYDFYSPRIKTQVIDYKVIKTEDNRETISILVKGELMDRRWGSIGWGYIEIMAVTDKQTIEYIGRRWLEFYPSDLPTIEA